MMPKWVERYIGLPYTLHGRTFDGVDCYGLCLLVWEYEFGLIGLRDAYYTSLQSEIYALSQGLQDWRRIKQPIVGDAVLFNYAGRPLHVGVVVQEGWMLHVENNDCKLRPKYSTCERYTAPLWRPRLEGFYRYAA